MSVYSNHELADSGYLAYFNDDRTIRQLNSFLRGEISAAETYRMAMDHVANDEWPAVSPKLDFLHQIQKEHGLAAQALRERIRALHGSPADSSGPWGAWAKLAQRTADLFGDVASLNMLKEGEEHGLRDYETGYNAMDATSAILLREELIPGQQRHIDLLGQLIQSEKSDA
jgi:bacterioferritin (cytochrome b1)